MRNCVDEGTLQAWFDGELNGNAAADVKAHLRACVRCAESARILESENAVVSAGLAAEFAEAIPTERLRKRINAAVAAMPGVSTAPGRSRGDVVRDFLASFRLPVYATAAAAILLAALLGLVYLRRNKPAPVVVQDRRQEAPTPTNTIAKAPEPTPVPIPVPAVTPEKPRPRPAKSRTRTEDSQPPATSLAWQERQYERAIAKLNEAIKAQPPMRPSLRVEYEYNLAVINDAIAATRDVARKNPKDPQATQFMLAAYQSKVDLMNQIADARVLER
jgi:hypothetical protein